MKIIKNILIILTLATLFPSSSIIHAMEKKSLTPQQKIKQLQQEKARLKVQFDNELTEAQKENIFQQLMTIDNEIHTQKLLLLNTTPQSRWARYKKAALVLAGLGVAVLTGTWLWNMKNESTIQITPVNPTPSTTNQKTLVSSSTTETWWYTDPSGNTIQLSQKPDLTNATLGTYVMHREEKSKYNDGSEDNKTFDSNFIF